MPFELQPTLTGELLELRPLRRDDFDALYAAASDPLIWEQHPESDRYTRDGFSAISTERSSRAVRLPSSIDRQGGSSARRAITDTTRPRARSKSAGRSWSARTGAARTIAR